MLTEAAELASVHKNIVVKIPCTAEGIKAIKALSAKNIPTNCTLVFNAGQAVLAAKAGARYVSPFVGRLDASIRHTRHIIDCMEAGAHVVTCPLKPILGLLDHPLTEKGLAKFVEDAGKMI
jgi:transaldolase